MAARQIGKECEDLGRVKTASLGSRTLSAVSASGELPTGRMVDSERRPPDLRVSVKSRSRSISGADNRSSGQRQRQLSSARPGVFIRASAPRQRCSDRWSQCGHAQRLVRGPAVRHRGRLQDLCGKLQGRGAAQRNCQRSLGDGERSAGRPPEPRSHVTASPRHAS